MGGSVPPTFNNELATSNEYTCLIKNADGTFQLKYYSQLCTTSEHAYTKLVLDVETAIYYSEKISNSNNNDSGFSIEIAGYILLFAVSIKLLEFTFNAILRQFNFIK